MSDETKPETKVETPKVKVKKEPKPLNVCWCGCGGLTKGRFVPGHDARFHGWAKQVARGETNEAETLAKLPHDEAREAFLAHVADERPKAQLRAQQEAQKQADRDQKKAERDAAKAAKETEVEEIAA